MGIKDEVTLQEFTTHMEKAVAAFMAEWGLENAENPEQWPASMPWPEWHEQFITWLDSWDGEFCPPEWVGVTCDNCGNPLESCGHWPKGGE